MTEKIKSRLMDRKGFTLIELIVVIAIIAILAAVLIPRFTGFTQSAREKATLSDARNIAVAAEALSADGKKFTSGTDVDEGAANPVYTAGEIMGYMGKATGGELTLTVDANGGITSFSYKKLFGSDVYTVSYTMSTGAYSSVTHAAGSITATALDQSY